MVRKIDDKDTPVLTPVAEAPELAAPQVSKADAATINAGSVTAWSPAGEVLVNSALTYGHQEHAAVAALSGGGYVVAWTSS